MCSLISKFGKFFLKVNVIDCFLYFVLVAVLLVIGELSTCYDSHFFLLVLSVMTNLSEYFYLGESFSSFLVLFSTFCPLIFNLFFNLYFFLKYK